MSAPVVKSIKHSMPRYPVLDGWRGISILCVLASHMLPLGPAAWDLNLAAGYLGMSLFFTLSGFLITTSLIFRLDLYEFAIRRVIRVVPLAWLYVAVVLSLQLPSFSTAVAHLLFYANLPPSSTMKNLL
ncbi:O-acetyltransferase OatA [Halomicronema hongdechloris C2206]|uniref:O-acetyltransferase OatA n=1 Tax=Halomicronema hongdechloris C2206 TaxID=1641165 RepID=A0A1Z3HMR7_9CYAN|nr:acyltransferase family protein [Halomicronema hongdechloris]ASC71575.1 O-acetyltransferase OatA [Halomicronema hongdechloris C2206]